MPRSKLIGFILTTISLSAAFLSLKFIFRGDVDLIPNSPDLLENISSLTYYTIAAPLLLLSMLLLCTGFHIGWTILTIKVVPPMPDITEKKDRSKPAAFILCLTSLLLIVILFYGIYVRSYWALAIPAALISVIILGAIFWIGLAILTSRNTLPEKKGK